MNFTLSNYYEEASEFEEFIVAFVESSVFGRCLHVCIRCVCIYGFMVAKMFIDILLGTICSLAVCYSTRTTKTNFVVEPNAKLFSSNVLMLNSLTFDIYNSMSTRELLTCPTNFLYKLIILTQNVCRKLYSCWINQTKKKNRARRANNEAIKLPIFHSLFWGNQWLLHSHLLITKAFIFVCISDSIFPSRSRSSIEFQNQRNHHSCFYKSHTVWKWLFYIIYESSLFHAACL